MNHGVAKWSSARCNFKNLVPLKTKLSVEIIYCSRSTYFRTRHRPFSPPSAGKLCPRTTTIQITHVGCCTCCATYSKDLFFPCLRNPFPLIHFSLLEGAGNHSSVNLGCVNFLSVSVIRGRQARRILRRLQSLSYAATSSATAFSICRYRLPFDATARLPPQHVCISSRCVQRDDTRIYCEFTGERANDNVPRERLRVFRNNSNLTRSAEMKSQDALE